MNINAVIEEANDESGVEFSKPDLSILYQCRRKPPELPLQLFGFELSKWLKDAANGAGAPVDYVAGGLMALSSILIGNARCISPWESWVEPCVFWVGLVGDPSSGKSPALEPIQGMIRILEKEMASKYEEQYREYETRKLAALCEREKWEKAVKEAVNSNSPEPMMPIEAIEPQEIVRPRIICNDTSTEKLGSLLSLCSKGLLLYRDELSGLIGSFDRYSGKDVDRSFLLEAFGGRSFTFDRVKHRLPIHIPRLFVSVMGGIQPDKLVTHLNGADDGFISRFLWIWPDPIPPFKPDYKPNNDVMLNAMCRLSSLSLQDNADGTSSPLILPLSEEAIKLFCEWRTDHHIDGQNVAGLFKSFYGKTPGYLLRFALIMELLWWAMTSDVHEPVVISAKAITAAAHLIEEYFKPMADRVFGDAAIPEAERLAMTLACYIVKTKPKFVNVRTLWRKARLQGLRKPDKAQLAVDTLEAVNWLLAPDMSALMGRPKKDYMVNPKLWEVLDEQVA